MLDTFLAGGEVPLKQFRGIILPTGANVINLSKTSLAVFLSFFSITVFYNLRTVFNRCKTFL